MAQQMTGRQMIWQPWEDSIVRETYPDYLVLLQRLPHRSYRSLRNRAGTLNIVKKRHHWTPDERKRLRQAFRDNKSDDDLLRLFPGMTLRQIQSMANFIRAPRRHVKTAKMDDEGLVSVREEAQRRGMTYRQVDELAKTNHYFSKTPQKPMAKHIVKAIEALGGTASIVWSY